MGEQAPAGWYPDGQGAERYWDGEMWTAHVRAPHAPALTPTPTRTPTPTKGGAFAKMGAAVKKAAADKQAAKEELSRQQAEYAAAAGGLVTSGVFGTSTIEIYEGGFVRVATWPEGVKGTSPSGISKKTPFECLRSIKFTRSDQAASGSGASAALEGTVGPAVASLMRGGAGLMKASAPGLAVAGLAHFAGAEGRKSFLTIATDKAIHTLSNQSSNGFISKSNKGHIEVGLALQAAAESVLGTKEVAAVAAPVPSAASGPRASIPNPSSAAPTLADRLRELAGLHAEGILSDDEFAAAKAKLLGGL